VQGIVARSERNAAITEGASAALEQISASMQEVAATTDRLAGIAAAFEEQARKFRLAA